MISSWCLDVGEQRSNSREMTVIGMVHRKLRSESSGRAFVTETQQGFDPHDHRFRSEVAVRELLRVPIEQPDRPRGVALVERSAALVEQRGLAGKRRDPVG